MFGRAMCLPFLCGDRLQTSESKVYYVGIFRIVSDRAFHLKHTITLFSLSNHDILSQEWRVIVHQVQINYNGRPMLL